MAEHCVVEVVCGAVFGLSLPRFPRILLYGLVNRQSVSPSEHGTEICYHQVVETDDNNSNKGTDEIASPSLDCPTTGIIGD